MGGIAIYMRKGEVWLYICIYILTVLGNYHGTHKTV